MLRDRRPAGGDSGGGVAWRARCGPVVPGRIITNLRRGGSPKPTACLPGRAGDGAGRGPEAGRGCGRIPALDRPSALRRAVGGLPDGVVRELSRQVSGGGNSPEDGTRSIGAVPQEGMEREADSGLSVGRLAGVNGWFRRVIPRLDTYSPMLGELWFRLCN